MFTVTVTCTRTSGAVNAIFLLLLSHRFGSNILEAKCHSAFHWKFKPLKDILDKCISANQKILLIRFSPESTSGASAEQGESLSPVNTLLPYVFMYLWSMLVLFFHLCPKAGVGNLRHACQAWHVKRFSMARWVNWNTVIMISQKKWIFN